MRTKEILELFLSDPKAVLHTREIARRAKIAPSTASKALNSLEKGGLLKSSQDGPLRKYSLAENEWGAIRLAEHQVEKFLKIPAERKEAIDEFLSLLEEQPVFSILFGSTAKGTSGKESDIDLLLVFNNPGRRTDLAKRRAEARTGASINAISIGYQEFVSNLKSGEDKVTLSATNTGIPLSNHLKYNLLMLSRGK